MSKFSGKQLEEMIQFLSERDKAIEYHCHLDEFFEIAKIKSVTLKKLHGRDDLKYNLRFFLRDHGLSCHLFREGTCPGVEGPISLKIRPESLSECEEVRVYLQSSLGPDFDQEKSSISSIDEFSQLFDKGVKIHKAMKLKEIFPEKIIDEYVELNCIHKYIFNKKYKFPLLKLRAVYLDPLSFKSLPLIKLVTPFVREVWGKDVIISPKRSTRENELNKLINCDEETENFYSYVLEKYKDDERLISWVKKVDPNVFNDYFLTLNKKTIQSIIKLTR